MSGLRTSSPFPFPFLIPLSLALLSACSSSPGGGPEVDAAPADDLPACSLGTTMAAIEEKLFRDPIKCYACHMTVNGKHSLYPTTLEFTSPNLAARMVDKPTESDPMLGQCRGRILVPKDDPLNGVFVQKVEKPSCGLRMPQALPPLSADQISCVKRWAILAARSVSASSPGSADAGQ
jgi:hypothetical protein